jgi:glycosyltransferase involved in cell wall biosynthesis
MPDVAVDPRQICSAGLEWRDYPTLIDAASTLTEFSFRLAAASPWSKHRNETEGRTLPPNVDARRYEYVDLRTLYAQSLCVAVPLYDNDFQAGVTTILEGMAMGKPVIATATTGQRDVIIDGETGLYVPPGDARAWVDAIRRVSTDASLREKLGRNGREWLLANASLKKWASTIADAIVPTVGKGGMRS